LFFNYPIVPAKEEIKKLLKTTPITFKKRRRPPHPEKGIGFPYASILDIEIADTDTKGNQVLCTG